MPALPLRGGAYPAGVARGHGGKAAVPAGAQLVRGALETSGRRTRAAHAARAGLERNLRHQERAMRRMKSKPPSYLGGRRPLALALPDPNAWMHRERTIALLKRYFRLAVETGRLPSVLGREFFRTRVTSERGYTFENSVIFVHDVERCLEKLDSFSRELLGWHVLQEFSLNETAQLMGCGAGVVYRGFLDSLDHLTEVFLEHDLISTGERKQASEHATEEEEKLCTR
jgi:hypothetical protein